MLGKYLLAALLLLASLPAARADSTVSAMTAASALTGPELFYCVQGAADRKCTATQLQTFIGTGSGTVTSVGLALPGGVFTVTGSPVTGSGTLTATPAGTSGGIPYFSSATSMASSAALTANLPVIGGGAGVAPTVGTVSGNTTKFATVNTTTFTTGQCVQVDASLNLTTTGSACGAGGGGTTIGTTTITSGVSGNFLYNNAGVYGERTPTQATAVLIPFSTSTTAQGVVPGSNGAAATSFLNATGAWSVPAGGGGSPGGSTLQVQYNNAGAFGGANVYVESANVLAQRNLANAQAYYVYNTTDAPVANYERATFDWTTTANTLTIGTQALGTGTLRPLNFVSSNFTFSTANGLQVQSGTGGGFIFGYIGGTNVNISGGSFPAFLVGDNSGNIAGAFLTTALNGGHNGARFGATSAVGWAPGAGNATGTPDTEILRGSVGHINFTSGTPTAATCTGFALTTGSTDMAGKVTFTSGTSCSINFAAAFTNAPFCVVSPGSAASTHDAVTSTTQLAVTFGTANTSMQWHCFGS